MPVRTLIKPQFSCEPLHKVMAEYLCARILHSHWRSHGTHPYSVVMSPLYYVRQLKVYY